MEPSRSSPPDAAPPTSMASPRFLCRECDYPLRQFAETRCPKCGRTFDSSDFSSVNFGLPVPRWLRWMLKPPSRSFYFWVGGATVLMLYAGSFPIPSFFAFLLALLLWVIVAIWWTGRALTFVGLSWRFRQPLRRRELCLRRWLTPPLTALATITLLYMQIPAALAFNLSRPAMDRLAAQVRKEPGPHADRRVGWYWAWLIDKLPNGGTEFAVRCGFLEWPVFTTEGPPVTARFPERWWYLNGSGWSIYVEDF